MTYAHLVCWDPEVVFYKSAFEPVGSQPVLFCGVICLTVCSQGCVDTWVAYVSANARYCCLQSAQIFLMSSFYDTPNQACESLCLKQPYQLRMIHVHVASVLFCHHCFMLWGHRFYHVVIFQEGLWRQVFSLQSCTNKFWLMCTRITKWDKMKEKNAININDNSTSTCLMQWIVSNDSLTTCTI